MITGPGMVAANHEGLAEINSRISSLQADCENIWATIKRPLQILVAEGLVDPSLAGIVEQRDALFTQQTTSHHDSNTAQISATDRMNATFLDGGAAMRAAASGA
jgi:hypothetical protein